MKRPDAHTELCTYKNWEIATRKRRHSNYICILPVFMFSELQNKNINLSIFFIFVIKLSMALLTYAGIRRFRVVSVGDLKPGDDHG